MSEVKKLQFWTTGEDFTRTVRDLIRSGHFWNAIEVLRDGGMEDWAIFNFILGGLKFEGDTREGNGLAVVKDEPEDLHEMLLTGWRTLCASEGLESIDFDKLEGDKHYEALKTVLPNPKGSILPHIWKDCIRREGFDVYDKPPLEELSDGVLLPNGYFVACGFQEHELLYPILNRLGFANSSRWDDDDKCFHLSSGSYSGSASNVLDNPNLYDTELPEDQLRGLFRWRVQFNKFYGYGTETITDAIRKYTVERTGAGAKYGNLVFLNKYYNFRLPSVSLTRPEGTYCIRTSPDKSIAGLLNSKFGIDKDSEYDAVAEIWKDWNKYKDVRVNNRLNLFYQEYLEGANGVAHYKEKGDFSYALSDNRGDVVRGKASNKILTLEQDNELRDICRTLHKDLGKQIQLEFVIKDELVYVVQLRTLDIPTRFGAPVNAKTLVTGYSFTKGDVTCSLDEVLIVDEDADSEDLLGKKALIVKHKVEFSHILALSQSLGIPSIYGLTADIELPNPIRLITMDKTGRILEG